MQKLKFQLKKILLIVTYFKSFPEWLPFYLESCRWNSTIDWLFFTDCPIPENCPTNVKFVNINYSDYCQLISEKLGIKFTAKSAYKLCDIKPAYGGIHQEYLNGFDYFGFGDIDIIYGDIRAFYTDEVLRYNTLSTMSDRVSGHFFLIKNDERWINAFRQIPNWQSLISDPINQCVDEYWFTKVIKGNRLIPSQMVNFLGLFDPYKRNHLFQERYTTPLTHYPWLDGTYNFPNRWYWYKGKLTTEFGGEFMYLHFMNWKSSKHLSSRYGKQAAWESLKQLIDPTLKDLSQGWCVSSSGFTPLLEEFKNSLRV
jgi:hypothetical protein